MYAGHGLDVIILLPTNVPVYIHDCIINCIRLDLVYRINFNYKCTYLYVNYRQFGMYDMTSNLKVHWVYVYGKQHNYKLMTYIIII